jgi:hypothetical protein
MLSKALALKILSMSQPHDLGGAPGGRDGRQSQGGAEEVPQEQGLGAALGALDAVRGPGRLFGRRARGHHGGLGSPGGVPGGIIAGVLGAVRGLTGGQGGVANGAQRTGPLGHRTGRLADGQALLLGRQPVRKQLGHLHRPPAALVLQ